MSKAVGKGGLGIKRKKRRGVRRTRGRGLNTEH